MKGGHLLMQYREKVSQQESPFPNRNLSKNYVNIVVFEWNADKGTNAIFYLATKISKSQYTLTISHNNNLNGLLWPVFQYFKDLASEELKYSIFSQNLIEKKKKSVMIKAYFSFKLI